MRRLVRCWALCAVLPALGGCAVFEAIFGTDDTPLLEGERISVLVNETSPTPRAIADPARVAALRLPSAAVNAGWTHARATPAQMLRHPALGRNIKRIWKRRVAASTKAGITSPPVIGNGRLFLLDKNLRVSAHDAETGRHLWHTRLDVPTEPYTPSLSGGIAVGDGRLFVATGLGTLAALDAETGEVLWRVEAGAPFRGPPTVSGGRVFSLSQDNRLSARRPDTGEVVWSHQGIAEGVHLLILASPAVADTLVIAPYSSGEVFALRAENGSIVWNDIISHTQALSSLTQVNAVATPVIDRGRVFLAAYEGRMVAIDMRTGRRAWERDISASEPPWVAGDYVFVTTTDGLLISLTRETGETVWTRRLRDTQSPDSAHLWSAPVLAGGRLFVASSEGVLAFVDPKSGEILGSRRLARGFWTPPIVARETLYLFSANGEIIALR